MGFQPTRQYLFCAWFHWYFWIHIKCLLQLDFLKDQLINEKKEHMW